MSALSVFFIIISILSFCLKTHPSMRVPSIRNVTLQLYANISAPVSHAHSAVAATGLAGSLAGNRTVYPVPTGWILDKRRTEPHDTFFYIECVCNGWFTFELVMRFVVAPSWLAFIRAPVNIIDFVATLSFYLDFLLTYLKKVRIWSAFARR